ncbi:MAG: hypothetical protein ACR2PE_03555 [Porticoccus sp.]
MSKYNLLYDYCEIRGLEFPANQKEADAVLMSIGSDLAPENLYEDGQLSDAQAMQKRSYSLQLARLVFSFGFALHGEVTQTDGYYDLLEVLNEAN